MKFVRLCSDLHIEGFYGTPVEKMIDYFVPVDERDVESVLVIAGDLSNKPDQIADFIAALEDRFIKVVYVFGNHEHYKRVYNDTPEAVQEQFALHGIHNTVCPGNDVKSYIIDGVKFITGTLWGECSTRPDYNADLARCIADFQLIKVREYGDDRYYMTPAYMRRLAEDHKKLIRDELAQATEDKVIVVTHHLPTYDAVSLRYKVSTTNGAFVNRLDTIWAPNESPNMFLFGHTHDAQEFVKDGILFRANPVGYRGEWGNPYNKYNSHCFIEI